RLWHNGRVGLPTPQSRRRFMRLPLFVVFVLGLSPALAHGQGNFGGTWETNWGPMTLKQEGNKVTGHSDNNGLRCDLTGTVEKNKLTFTYLEGEVKGEGWFELAGDGKSFTGKWRPDGSTEWRGWTGKR